MECKVYAVVKAQNDEVDLIDTLWNVKRIRGRVESCMDLRFNRYIVECKEKVRKICEKLDTGFNRYIVECKAIEELKALMSFDDLIDTLWNVKN